MKYTELSKLKQAKKLSNKTIWTFDVETKDGLEGKILYCWSLATNSGGKNREIKVYSGKSMDLFFKTLKLLNREGKKYQQSIFVHNLSFDIRFIIDYCLSHKIGIKPIYANSTIILCYINGLNFKFIDSFQFLLSSQEKAEITYILKNKHSQYFIKIYKELLNSNYFDEYFFYLPEIKNDLDFYMKYCKIDCNAIFNKKYKDWSKEEKQLVIDHNKNDVLALQYILKQFRKTMFEVANVDLLQINTLASLSLKAFRKCLSENIVNGYIQMEYSVKEKKYNYVLNEEKYKFAKESYFGGRTECFNHSLVKNVKYFDKVSMFPSQMKFQLYPKGIPYWSTNPIDISESLTDKLSIIECKMIPNKSEKYPVLPIRFDNKTLFANVEYTGIWTSVEINYAIERGYQFEFYRALIFPEKFNPFEKFIDKFFAIKQKSEGSERQIAKIILNSCYGKFGQKVYQKKSDFKFFESESEALVFYEEQIDNNIEANMSYNEVYKQYCVRFSEECKILQPFQIVHLSSFITAYSRIELLKGIHNLTDNNYTVYYCDTDSIVTTDNSVLSLGKELGCWDIEKSFNEYKCLVPKCYIAFDSDNKMILKLKGIRRDKLEEISKECKTISEVELLLKDEIVMNNQYLPLKSSLIRFKKALSSTITFKHLKLINSKRKILSDFSTIPLTELK